MIKAATNPTISVGDFNITSSNKVSPIQSVTMSVQINVNYSNSVFDDITKIILELPSLNNKVDADLLDNHKVHKSNLINEHRQYAEIWKFEYYCYYPLDKLEEFKKILEQKDFKYTEDKTKFPNIFNIQLAMEGKIHNWRLKNNNLSKYLYKEELVKVLIYKNCPYLIRIYRLYNIEKPYFKFEITYLKNDRTKKPFKGDPLRKVKAIIEIAKKITKKFQKAIDIGDEDYSWWISIEEFLKNYSLKK